MDASLISYFMEVFNRNKRPIKETRVYGPGEIVKVKFAEICINLDGYEFNAKIKEYIGSGMYSATDLNTNTTCLVEAKEIIERA